jgi:steroid delta-isomerase-like uncharacterized protein
MAVGLVSEDQLIRVHSPGEIPMLLEENMAILRRFNEEVWNKGNMAVANETFASNYIAHDPSHPGAEPRGPQSVIDFATMFRAGFPDIHITIEDMFAAGDKVAWRLSWRATHTAEYLGIPATGRQINVKVIGINRVVNGRVVESWGIVDHLGSMQQLGVVPTELAAPTGN